MIFKFLFRAEASIACNTLPIKKPAINAAPISTKMRPTNDPLNPTPVSRALATATVMANKTMMTTSIETVTPKVVLVKLPFALTSLITAMVDAGERANRIVPPRRARATRPAVDSPSAKGRNCDKINSTIPMSTSPTSITDPVVRPMVRNRLRISFRYNSLPATKAITASDNSST